MAYNSNVHFAWNAPFFTDTVTCCASHLLHSLTMIQFKHCDSHAAAIIIGIPGKTGMIGSPGRMGLPGKTGQPGQDGNPGQDGEDGVPGMRGLPGKEVLLCNGVGLPESWHSYDFCKIIAAIT